MIGIDIIAIARMQAFINKFGELALARFLNTDEIALCKRDVNAANVSSANMACQSFDSCYNIPRVAGFWAAKEACAKALGVGISKELGFLDIYISKNTKNAPQIHIADSKMQAFHINKLALSISHDGGFAIAAVIAL